MVLFPNPKEETLLMFIQESSLLEGIDVSLNELNLTLRKKKKEPYSFGHISAVVHAIRSLSSNPNFPCKTINELDPKKPAPWLNELHSKLMHPLFELGWIIPAFTNRPKLEEIGTYRTIERNFYLPQNDGTLTKRPLPKTKSIQKLLYLWNRELCQFHIRTAPKILKYSSMKNEEWEEIDEKANEMHIQLQCIHPFVDGTGRIARIIENTLRLRWGLPWKIFYSKDKMEYIRQIQKYEDSSYWQSHLKENGAI